MCGGDSAGRQNFLEINAADEDCRQHYTAYEYGAGQTAWHYAEADAEYRDVDVEYFLDDGLLPFRMLFCPKVGE